MDSECRAFIAGATSTVEMEVLVGPRAPFVRLNTITEVMPVPRYFSSRSMSVRVGDVRQTTTISSLGQSLQSCASSFSIDVLQDPPRAVVLARFERCISKQKVAAVGDHYMTVVLDILNRYDSRNALGGGIGSRNVQVQRVHNLSDN